MKKIYLIISIVLFFTYGIRSQNPVLQWVKGINVNNSHVTVDSLNNIYVTGKLPWATVDFDPGSGVANLTGAVNGSCFIAKYDSNGNYVWAYIIGVEGVGEKLAVKGNYIHLLCNLTGTVDLNPGSGVSTVSLTSSGTACVVKFDLNANFILGLNFGSGYNIGTDIKVDDSKNVYLCGTTIFSSQAAFINKYDASGNLLWQKNYLTTSPSSINYGINFNSMDIDNSQNVYLLGQYNYNCPALGLFTPPASERSVFLLKLDTNGNLVFVKSSDINYNAQPYWNSSSNVVTDIIKFDATTNSIVITGKTLMGSSSDFDFGAGIQTLGSTGGKYIVKYDLAANFIWGFYVAPDAVAYRSDLFVDQTGSIFYTTSMPTATVTMHPAPSTPTLSQISSNQDIVIAKYTPAGNHSWSFNLGGANPNNIGTGIVCSGSDVIICGYNYNSSLPATVDYDPSASTSNLATYGPIVKYADCSIPLSLLPIKGNTTLCSGSVNTYSVPMVSGAASYNWSLPGGWSGSSTTNTISGTAGLSGTFSVTATNACGTSAAQTLSVTVNMTPTISVNSGSICTGNSFTINPTGASTYTITGGSAIVNPTGNASYSVTGTSAAGCASSNTAVSNVTVNALPTINASTTKTLMCTGESVTLTGNGASTYTWNPGGTGTSISVSPTITSTYTLNGTDVNGCMNSSVFTQSVSLCTGVVNSNAVEKHVIVYPNPFNDLILVSSNETKQAVQVFNALGSVIYNSTIENEITEINLSNHSSGIYFIRIGTVTKKIIKE